MRLAVLADDDGEIIAVAQCRMSLTGEVGTFTEDAEIRAEITRSALDAHRGRTPSDRSEAADALVTSVVVELPEEFRHMNIEEIHRTMMVDRSGRVATLVSKADNTDPTTSRPAP